MGANIGFDVLLAFNEVEAKRWHEWFNAHQQALDVPIDIAGTRTARGMLLHIFGFEQVTTERIVGASQVAFPNDLPSDSVDAIFGIGERARNKFREFLASWSDADWEREETFRTVTAGMYTASRQKVFASIMVHSLRHWAQLATALRQFGFKQDWSHDLLFSTVMQ